MAENKIEVFKKLNQFLTTARNKGINHISSGNTIMVSLENMYGSYVQTIFANHTKYCVLAYIQKDTNGKGSYAGHFIFDFREVKSINADNIELNETVDVYVLRDDCGNIVDKNKNINHYKHITLKEFMTLVKINPGTGTPSLVVDTFSGFSHTFDRRFNNPAYDINSYLNRTLK